KFHDILKARVISGVRAVLHPVIVTAAEHAHPSGKKHPGTPVIMVDTELWGDQKPAGSESTPVITTTAETNSGAVSARYPAKDISLEDLQAALGKDVKRDKIFDNPHAAKRWIRANYG